MTLYTFLKFLHVLLAIIAVGFNASYGIWLSRAARDQRHTEYVLRGVKLLDDRFANPAYGLLLVTGFAMVGVGGIPLSTFWISTALGLYVVLVLLGLLGYTPMLRKQIAMVEGGRAQTEEYQRMAKRSGLVGVLLTVLVLVMVFLMVAKPTL